MGQTEKVTWETRPYQQQAHDAAFREFDQGVSSTLVVMPTGTGKTKVAASATQTMRDRGLRTLFLVHREVLLSQAARTLRRCGLETAIEMASQHALNSRGFAGLAWATCATVQSLQGARLEQWPRDQFGLIITDEAHRAGAENHQNVYKHFSSAFHLGITATPDGSSGQIGNIYKTQAYHYPLPVAIRDGYLVPPIQERCKISIDLRGLRVRGDYNLGDLAERIGPHCEEIADAIKQRIGSRFAVVFMPTVKSAVLLAAMLCHASPSGPALKAKAVVGEDSDVGLSRKERNEVLSEFADRRFQVIVSCDMLFEGWDATHTSAVVIARPTVLRYRYAQMVGRGLRPCPELGKDRCLVIDFDWKTDGEARNLITPVDLYAEDDPDLKALDAPSRASVTSKAREKADAGMEPQEALEEAKADLKVRSTMPLFMTGKKASFEVQILDPLGVAHLCGIALKKRSDFASDRHAPAEAYQQKMLAKAGLADCQGLSFYGASKLIREVKRREKHGLANLIQVRDLNLHGIGPKTARVVTATQAEQMLRTIQVG